MVLRIAARALGKVARGCAKLAEGCREYNGQVLKCGGWPSGWSVEAARRAEELKGRALEMQALVRSSGPFAALEDAL